MPITGAEASALDASNDRVTLAPYALIVLIYTLTHGLSLANRGLFWDDWIFWQQDRSVVAEAGRSMGSTWPSAINNLFYYSQTGITLDRAVTFISFLLVALLLFGIVRRMPKMTVSTAVWVAVLFSVFPVYQARIALVMVGYGLCLLFFTTAIWLLVRFRSPRPWYVWLFSAVLMVVSFQTASLLVFFYAVVPLVLLVTEPLQEWKWRPAVRVLMRRAAFLAVPVVYWVSKRVFFPTSGLYSKYNVIGGGKTGFWGNLVHGVVNSTLFAVADAIPGVISKGVVHPGLKPLLLMGAIVGAAALLGLIRWQVRRGESDTWLTHVGGMFLVAAVAAYAAVGKIPTNVGWETRHQLLVPFGAALMTVGVAQRHAESSKLARVVISVLLVVLIGVSAGEHVNSYIAYERDWLKQRAIMEIARTTPELKTGRYILIEDKTKYLNQADWPPYTYTGMFAETFGDESRLVYPWIPGARWFDYAKVRPYFLHTRYYKTADYSGQSPDYVVTIRKGPLDLRSGATVLRLVVLDWTDRPKLDRELRRALSFTIQHY